MGPMDIVDLQLSDESLKLDYEAQYWTESRRSGSRERIASFRAALLHNKITGGEKDWVMSHSLRQPSEVGGSSGDA